MIDVSRLIQLLGLYCNSFKSFVMFLCAGLVLFVCFAIIKMVMRVKVYV